MAKHSKAAKAAKSSFDRTQSYVPTQAVELMRKNARAKFDETVEVHFRLGVNVRHADQMVRGTTILPHGTGRSVRVAVFAQGDKAREAQEAGADIVGGADLAAEVEAGNMDFDVAIATPDMMGVVGRLGRVLGPRGLMPNPKAGTVTFDVARAVAETKAGKVEYRTDRTGIVHLAIGKLSFSDRQILENYGSVLEEIVRAKPSSAKGRYLKSIVLTSTMGPGVPLDTSVVAARDVVVGLSDGNGASADADGDGATDGAPVAETVEA